MKIVLAPDKFKGTITSLKLCQLISQRILLSSPNIEVVSLPIADGGDGSIECILSACGGKLIYAKALNAQGEMINTCYGLTSDNVAIIEVAKVIGLAGAKKLSPMKASSYGVGQLIRHALDSEITNIILCLGGSSTTDGGSGLLQALGVEFVGVSGTMCGDLLSDIIKINTSKLYPKLKNANITLMCDVTNTLYGQDGSAYVYAPQKGANPTQVKLLDEGLTHYCDCLKDACGVDYSSLEGGGSAGGIAVGCVALLNARLNRGIDVVMKLVKFDEQIKDADLVVTGEGKIDSQSLKGKVVGGIASACKQKGVPVVAIVGSIDCFDMQLLKEIGVNAVFSTVNRVTSLNQVKKTIKRDIINLVDNILAIASIVNR